MSDSRNITDSSRHKVLTALNYFVVALALWLGWYYADLNLIHAEEGIGYSLGITGSVLMALLLLYPLRKRTKALRNWFPVRYWFRVHMVFGIVGPLFVIFHSNFQLGSLNSRIALFCTIIVASSGIVGRYIYAQLHYGLYGKRADLVSLRNDISDLKGTGSGISKLIPSIDSELNHWEDKILSENYGFVRAFAVASSVAVTSRIKLRRLIKLSRSIIAEASVQSETLDEHRPRLESNVQSYLRRRISLLRKFAQYKAFESLFSLWHIVHYPLFFLLVIAAIVHVVAVHMY